MRVYPYGLRSRVSIARAFARNVGADQIDQIQLSCIINVPKSLFLAHSKKDPNIQRADLDPALSQKITANGFFFSLVRIFLDFRSRFRSAFDRSCDLLFLIVDSSSTNGEWVRLSLDLQPGQTGD